MAVAPVKYDDPSVLALASNTEQQLGLPSGLLTSIITKGERSNSDQVSSAGARTVAQITPATRQLAIKKYGVDPYLSTQNAVEVAGNLLKDSLDRNNGDVGSAIGEYIGGTDRSNWGRQTNAYIQRVTAGLPDATPPESAPVPAPASNAPAIDGGGPSTFDRAMAAQAQGQAGSVANVYKAYQSGQMSPEDAKAFEDHVNSGSILLPQGASLNATAAPSPAAAAATVAPPALVQAYQSGQMAPQDRQDFESLVKSGQFSLPQGVQIGQVAPGPSLGDKIAAVPGAIAESLTGASRRTPTTDALPDYAGMPELNQASMASFKTGLGTMTAGPQEIGQIVQANFPNDKVSHDEKGNVLITSSIDGKTYAVKPGFQFSDVPRALGAITAFTPAGRAESAIGGALGSAATQAAIEGTKAATGGNFDASNVGVAGLMGGAAPLIAKGFNAASNGAKALLTGVRGAPDPIAAAEAPVAAAAADPAAAPATVPAAAPVAPVVLPAPVVPMAADDLATTARAASQGDKTATQVLAEQAAPDAQTVASAKRLGVEDYLQPDHVTTNQAYRELAQAVKSVPGSATRAAELDGLSAVGERADKLISDLGGSTDLEALNSNVKGALQNSATEQKAAADKAWTAYRAQIPSATVVETPATTQALQAMATDLGGVEGLVKALPAAAKKFLTPMLDNQGVTHGYLDLARKQIGNAIAKGAGPFSDLDQGTLKHLYSAVTADQEAVATQVGGQALQTFKAAKAATTLQKGFEDDLASLFGKSLDGNFVGGGDNGLRGAVASASKSSATGLVRLLSAVPQEMRQNVTLSGIASTFRNAKGQGPYNPNSYVNWYEGLQRNRQSYAAVMANVPLAARKQLAALYNVSKGIQQATRERITTGRIMAVKDQLKGADTLMGRMYEAAKSSAGRIAGVAAIGHVVGPGIGAAVGSALTNGAKPEAIKAVDSLISSPEFAAAVARAAQGQAPQAAKELGNSAKFRKFVAAVGSPPEMTDRQRWILQALQANNSQGNH